MSEMKMVPELRFPGFGGEWESKKMGDEILFLAGHAFESSKMSSTSSKYQLIKMTNVYKNELLLDRNSSYWPELTAKQEKFLLNKGDVVITLTGTVGKKDYGYSTVIDHSDKFLLNQRLVRLRGKDEHTTSGFINHLITTDGYLDKFFLTSKGGTGNQSNVSVEAMKEIQVAFPNVFEQHKIASFLTTVDEKLQALKKKKSLLEEYKKGLMQRIFSQELRFKDEDGKDFPDWEEKKFGDVYAFKPTNSFSRENLNYQAGVVKNIHYGDIHTRFKSYFKLAAETVPFVNPEISIGKIAEENYCQEGDLIIADTSEDYDDVGKAIEIVSLNGQKTLAGLHTILARPDLAIMSIGFSAFIMKSSSVRSQIMNLAQGTKVLSIAASRLAVISINTPSVKEQKLISEFLSALVYASEHLGIQVSQIEIWKRGILQQMFV